MSRKYFSFWEKRNITTQKEVKGNHNLEYEDNSNYYENFCTHFSLNYFRNYNSYSSEIVSQFTDIYKHIDDFRAILQISKEVKIYLKSGHSDKEKIFIPTLMFSDLDKSDSMNICLGAALIEFAKYYLDHTNHKWSIFDYKEFDRYEDFVLQKYPGYYSFINNYKQYLLTLDPEFFSSKYHNDKIAQFYNQTYSRINTTLIQELINGTIIFEKQMYLHICSNNVKVYNKYKNKIAPYISSVANSLNQFFINTKVRYYGSRTGILDSNKLVDALQGAPNVYYNEFEKKTNKIDIVILVDQSGSMEGNRISLAKSAVILLNEACLQLNCCDLYIYGHSADKIERGYVDLYCYNDKYNTNKYSLGTLSAQNENRDGDAIRKTIQKVREQSQNKLLLFVLSDGEPSAYNYHGNVAILDTKNAVIEVEKQNVIVAQCKFKSTYIQSEKMFKNCIEIDNDDISEFSTKFVRYVTNTLIANYDITES